MTIKSIKNDIVNMLQEKGSGRSFVELEKINGFAGSQEMVIGDKNIVIWSSISEEAIMALDELRLNETINIVETSPLTYHADGTLLSYPLAKKNRKYKNSRWLPSAINKGKQFPNSQ